MVALNKPVAGGACAVGICPAPLPAATPRWLDPAFAGWQNAATVTSGEAASLLARINGQLAQQGDAESGERVRVLAENATQGCPDDGEDEVRTAALNAFLNMNSEQALPMLKQILARRDACSAKLREKAVFLFSQKRGSEVEDILVSTARQDPSSRVREQTEDIERRSGCFIVVTDRKIRVLRPPRANPAP